MPDLSEIFKAIHVAMVIAPDVEKLLDDLSTVLSKYVGPDIDKLKTDLEAVLKQYQAG